MSYEIGSGGPTSFNDYMSEELRNAVTEIKDLVNHPEHYTHNEHGIECIQAIQASMSAEEFQGFLKGNTMKYLWRYKYKGKPKQDLEKAQWYLNKLLESVDE